MNKQDIINSFKKLDINLSPAGVWDFDSNGKKTSVDANRADKLPLDQYPDDNMFKFRIEETPYMCIDIDGADILEVMMLLPSIANTFTTTTTADNKLHCYVMKPETFPATRVINKVYPNVDILTNGIVFEGHLYNHKHSKYNIGSSKDIVSLTQKEIDLLTNTLSKSKLSSSSTKAVQNARYHIEEAELVKAYINETITKVEYKKLCKLLTPSDKRTKDLNFPLLSHDTINTMSFYLSLNAYLKHEDVIKFMEKILVVEYNLSLNSEHTKLHWFKSILPTLPIVEDVDYTTDFMEYIKNAPTSTNGLFKLLSTVGSNGELKYIQINKNTTEPRQKNGVMLLQAGALRKEYPTLDSDTWAFGIPDVQITSNPFAIHSSYEVDDDTFILSTLKRTEYQINIQPIEKKPNNVLTKSISGIFKPLEGDKIDAEDFYYHWLSHVLFSSEAVTTILALVTPSNVKGGTGKTTLTATLPMHICQPGTITAINDSMAKWSADAFLGRMAAFDDLFASEKWKEVYTIIKQQTSNTIKILDKKGKGTVLSDRRTNISISANFIPKIDESDRRFFMWSPRERLDDSEGNQIAKILENYKEYSQEIQDIANYCYYLFNNHKDKYYHELYIKAPNTDISKLSKSEGGLGETLISRILSGPDRLFDDYIGGGNKWTDVQIAKFIVQNVEEPNNRCKNYTVALPWNFYNEVIKALKADENVDYTKGRLALVMGQVHFKDIGAKRHSKYSSEFPTWTRYGLLHDIDEEVLGQYKKYLELKQNSTESKQTLIIDGV